MSSKRSAFRGAKRVAFLSGLLGVTLVAIGFSLPASANGTAIGFSLPASANGTTVTTFSASPTTIRSGDGFNFLVNDTSAPNASVDTFTGCYVYWVNDQAYSAQIVNVISLPQPNPFRWPNYTAQNGTLRYAGYANTNCSPLPSGTPTWDTGILTITPQLVIDTVQLTTGIDSSTVSLNYSEKPATIGAVSPFDWTTGGSFAERPASECGLQTAELPSGVSIDGTVSANGTPPTLSLQGTPGAGSAGSYQTCAKLTGNSAGAAFAVMNVTVSNPAPVPAPNVLPNTGAGSIQLTLFASGALLTLTSGAVLLLLRRRHIR